MKTAGRRQTARGWSELFVASLLLASAACQDAGPRGDPELSDGAWEHVRERLVTCDEVDPPGRSTAAAPTAEPTRVALPGPSAEVLAAQAAGYRANVAKSVLDLQPFRVTQSIPIRGNQGQPGRATLVNLNPTINEWYLLEIRWVGDESTTSYHLANANPTRQDLVLDSSFPSGLMVVDSTRRTACALWSESALTAITAAAAAAAPYVRLCDDAVTLRLRTAGRRTATEKITDFLRDNVWGGESVTALVRRTLAGDAFLETGEIVTEGGRPPTGAPSGPRPALLDPRHADDLLVAHDLGIETETATDGQLVAGQWYRAIGTGGVFVSVVQPSLLASEILESHVDVVGPLDDVERRAVAYLVAFDLDRFELRFAVGTDHPRVGWSDRVPAQARNDALPGPDGIGTIAPLVGTGIVGPAHVDRVAATFTAGFKRAHGAFKYGELSLRNHGSHYGFLESGVTLSKPQPDLATLLVLEDGTVEMKSWRPDDDTRPSRIAFARQNGMAIIERDPATGHGVPGPLVARWGPGNWSGSQDGKYRTLRAGACLLDSESRRFLVYGYFSSGTPPAMARVFQAYGCDYAMLLDMNALEHSYLAVYTVRETQLEVQHLIEGMSVLDRDDDGELLPRFVGYADNRDFFYLMRRPHPEGPTW